MKRLDQLKRSLKSYKAWYKLNEERILNGKSTKPVLQRARVCFRNYEKKIRATESEIEKYLAGRKKVKRVFKSKEEKSAVVRKSVDMPNDSKQWLKPLRKNNLENKEVVKPVYF